MLHALKPFTVDDKNARISVQQPKAGATVQYLSPTPLKFRQWDGYTPEPDRQFPNQWHVEAGTQEECQAIGMLTIIVPYRTAQAAAWKSERLENETAVGIRLQCESMTTTVAFRKAAVKGTAMLNQILFDQPVTVENAKLK
jgi:hypothetical protein